MSQQQQNQGAPTFAQRINSICYLSFVAFNSMIGSIWSTYVIIQENFPFDHNKCSAFWLYIYAVTLLTWTIGIGLICILLYNCICSAIGNTTGPQTVTYRTVSAIVGYALFNIWGLVIYSKDCIHPEFANVFRFFTIMFFVNSLWFLITIVCCNSICGCARNGCGSCSSCCCKKQNQEQQRYDRLPSNRV